MPDLRPFIEECDQLQGLQVLSSVDDAWGGFSSRYVERLRDDFGKLPIWVWGLEEEEKKARDQLLRQLANQSLSLHALAATASAYIPLAAGPKAPRPRYINDLDPSSRWHTAALQAALLETATLPSRLRGERMTPLAQMEAVFDNGGNRRVVEARMSVGEAGGLKEALDERVRAKEEGGGEQTKKAKSFAHEDEEEEEGEEWDVDLSRLGPEEQIVQMMQRGRRGGGGHGGGGRKKTRLFGRAEALRGAWQGEGEVEALNQRARDRFAGAPMVQRLVFFWFWFCSFLSVSSKYSHDTADTPPPSSFPPAWTATPASLRLRSTRPTTISPFAPRCPRRRPRLAACAPWACSLEGWLVSICARSCPTG
ncbi:mtDNA inheritance, partitioning of the mitochondrial organelle [Diplodia seriata]